MSERERAEQVVPVWIQQEAQRCAASNGRIDPAYLTGLWRRGAEFRTVVDQHGEILTQAAVDRLLSALPVEGDMPHVCQWREIATAPKDGTVIDVWLGDASDEDLEFYCTPGTRRSAGWHFREGRFRPYMGLALPVVTVRPTHWMPLPAPPVALVPAEGEK